MFFSFQDKRISVVDALAHPYLDEGRLRYHSCMCKCCYTTASGMRQYTSELETTAPQSFDDHWERKLTSIQQVKGKKTVQSIYLFLLFQDLKYFMCNTILSVIILLYILK